MVMRVICFLSAFIFLLTINPTSPGAEEIYTVRGGDSLYKIAKKFKVNIEDLKEKNGLNSTQIKPGAKLTIPSPQTRLHKKDVEVKKDSAENAVKKSANSGNLKVSSDAYLHESLHHTVRKGETLASISKRYSISIEDLREINNIRDSRRLREGMQLLLKRTGPKTYTVRRGDNIWRIAKRFGVNAEDLMEINELDSEDLRPGQKLLLEAQSEPPDVKNYRAVISESRLVEDINALSESQELNSMGMKDRLILFAKKMLNVPYRFGGNTFMGIDCSAYVQKVFGFLDIHLPRSAREQFKIGESVSKEDLSIGDLVFFRTYASFPSHVGIYLGNNLFIHASSKNRRVSIDSLDTPYYIRRFIGARRLFPEDTMEKKETDEKG